MIPNIDYLLFCGHSIIEYLPSSRYFILMLAIGSLALQVWNLCCCPKTFLQEEKMICEASCDPRKNPFVGPCPHKDRDYRIGTNFRKFYLIKTGFTLGEPVSLVKVFRLF
jgi:hypothetical protein